jgi:RecA/RadA recombinase
VSKPKKDMAAVDPAAILRKIVEKEKDEEGYGYVYGDVADTVISAPRYYYPTGLQLLDGILGNGGLGSGRITEIYGPNRTAKSELLQRICEEFLKKYPDGLALYYDQEQALDNIKLSRVPAFRDERFAVVWAATIEKLFMRLQDMLVTIHAQNPLTPIIVGVDSLAALETDEEHGKELDEVTMMGMARVLSKAFRKIRRVLQSTSAHLIFLNQVRNKPNQMANAELESPGGEALKFWADYRIHTKPKGNFYFHPPKFEKDADRLPPDGLLVEFKTVKNKLATPLRTVTIPVLFKHTTATPSGLSNTWSLFRQLLAMKKLESRGGRYFLPGLQESFPKDEWPIVCATQKEKVDAIIQPWIDSIMLKEGAVELDGEDD